MNFGKPWKASRGHSVSVTCRSFMPRAYQCMTQGKQQRLPGKRGTRQTQGMSDEQKRSLISATLITQIEGFIQRNGRDHDAFVVGVADDLDATLQQHGVNRDKHVCLVLN